MANNYLQFSEVLTKLSPEEEAWLKSQLQCVAVVDGQEVEIDGVEDQPAESQWAGPRFLRDDEDFDPDSDVMQFEYMFDDDTEEWGRYLWIHADDYGNPEHVVALVQKFLKQFRPYQCWWLTYAITCSKPRVGEFWGGAVFVTADRIEWDTAHDFAIRQEREFKAKSTNLKDSA